MLKVPSKYRVARRLGAGVFDQTQTQKFALRSAERKEKRGRAPSDYGKQLLEKQRVRFTYGISEGQLSNYAEKAFTQKDPSLALHRALEMRADMVMYRSGFASTRRSARQMVSHGHIMINGKRTKVPSTLLKKGDKITIRGGSKTNLLFAGMAEKNESRAIAQWLKVDVNEMTVEIVSEPQYSPVEVGLDYATVFEFYSR